MWPKRRSILGCGASTKGNVILQYCNLSVNDEDKFGITGYSLKKIKQYMGSCLRKPTLGCIINLSFFNKHVKKMFTLMHSPEGRFSQTAPHISKRNEKL